MTNQVSVTDNQKGVSEEEMTRKASGVSEKEMPANQAADGKLEGEVQQEEAKVSELQKQIDALKAQAEQDISKLRSSLQSQLSAQEKEWKRKEDEYRQQMFELETKGLPEDEVVRKRLELAERENQRLAQELEQREQALREQNNARQWQEYFENEWGIPRNQLDMENGFEAMIQSGWNAASESYRKLKEGSGSPEVSQEGDESNEPHIPGKEHTVVKSSTGTQSKTTWADLEAKYGDREKVFTLVEEGRLPASIIPLPDMEE